MRDGLYFPQDSLDDSDLAADFLELSAFFADDGLVTTSSLANTIDIGVAEDYANVDEEIREGGEQIVSNAVRRLEKRQYVLGSTYPFFLDDSGDILTCNFDSDSVAQTAYILSLILSHLRSVSPVLDSSELHPDDSETTKLRGYFQYFATTALAAEIRGDSWSFGFPRPDHSNFISKLQEIWRELRDGNVAPQIGAPTQPKDDGIDVFAARPHPDQLPGFLLAAAQVATGKDWKQKSLRGRLSVFKQRWFTMQPATDFIGYMIIPFARPDDAFTDDVRVTGNLLHRLRLPRKVEEARELKNTGRSIEAYNLLPEAARWVAAYRDRARTVN